MAVQTDIVCRAADTNMRWRRDICVDEVGFVDEFWFSWTEQSPDLADMACVPRGYATPALEMWCRLTDEVVRCGYLKLSCGSPDLAALTPTIFHWANLRAGWGVCVDGTPEDLWRTAHSYAVRSPASSPTTPPWRQVEPPTDPAVLASDIAALARHLKRRFSQQRRISDEMAATHVVAFSRLGEQWKRRGLGQLMYRTCAAELAVRRSAALVGSSTQSGEATALWDRLSEDPCFVLRDVGWSADPRPALDYTN